MHPKGWNVQVQDLFQKMEKQMQQITESSKISNPGNESISHLEGIPEHHLFQKVPFTGWDSCDRFLVTGNFNRVTIQFLLIHRLSNEKP